MKRLNILIIEDDRATREMLEAAFRENGHLVRAEASMKAAWSALQREKPDIIILDRGLPDGDGFQLCLSLKKDNALKYIPILILTGKAETPDKILGLRFGADDYLSKPFSIEELMARVDAIIRRICGSLSPKMSHAGIAMDLKARTATYGEQPLELTNREFALLRVFLENQNALLTREQILETVWAGTGVSDPKIVDVTLMNLRRKIGGEGGPITTIRAAGYRLDCED